MVKLRQTIEDRDPHKFEAKIEHLKKENQRLNVTLFSQKISSIAFFYSRVIM